MNGLAGLSIAAIFVLGVASVSAINGIRNNEAKIEQVKKAKEIIKTIKQSDIASKAVGNHISHAGYIPNVNPNSLNLNSITLSDKSLITKFTNAMEYAVIRNNIRKPACSDLAATGLISLDECKYIADKKGLYVNIKNGTLEIASSASRTKKDDLNRKINTFIHITKTINGIQDAPVAKTDNPQISAGNYFNRTETSSVKVPLTTSVIKQTINTNDIIAKKTIIEESIKKNLKDLNNRKKTELIILTLANTKSNNKVSKPEKNEPTVKTKEKENSNGLTQVSLKDEETLNGSDSFKTSFAPVDNGVTDDKNGRTERRQ